MFCETPVVETATHCSHCGAALSPSVDVPSPPVAAESGDDADLVELLRRGEKITAIKRYRERTGCDLRGAKEAVEALAARHGIQFRRVGCLGGTAAAIAIGVAVRAIFGG
jgi:hypothetical protein